MADRTLAERARELADDEKMWFSGDGYDLHRVGTALLRSLADENDALDASNHAALSVLDAKFTELEAERDRYWNLAEQLGEALTEARDRSGELRHAALVAFRAEKDSHNGVDTPRGDA